MTRINKILNKYSSKMDDLNIEDKEGFLKQVLSCDITQGKYIEFILTCFINKTIRKEDLNGGLESTVGTTISLFHKNKEYLPVKDRSLNRYKTVGDLWKAVKDYQDNKSSHEVKKEHREKINKETKFIVDEDYKIAVPLTEEASKFWGKGTRWCTAADKNNAFECYDDYASLYIVILPDGKKFQFWHYQYDYEAMDETDNKLTLSDIEKNWTYFEKLKNIIHLSMIPNHLKTKEICESAIKKRWCSLKHVPEDLKTKELCELAIKNHGYALQYVPEELKTKELCELAVKNNGHALEYVPEKLRTNELCEIAVKNDWSVLEYLPEDLRTKELCELAVKKTGWALKDVPKDLKTKELCEIAVSRDGFALEYVPEEMKTEELCMLSARHGGFSIGPSLKFIPKKFKTKSICKLSVTSNIYSFEFVPEELKTKEFCEFAINQDGFALKYVPREIKTKELCEFAVSKDGFALEYVPEEMRTEKLCELALKQNKSAIECIPNKLKHNY